MGEWFNRTAMTWVTSLACFALIWRSQELAASRPLMAGVFPITTTGAFSLWGLVVGAYLGIKTLNDRAQAKLDKEPATTSAPVLSPSQPVTVTTTVSQESSNATQG